MVKFYLKKAYFYSSIKIKVRNIGLGYADTEKFQVS